MVIEPFISLAARERWDDYYNLLCEKGLDWWFNMEIPLLAEHLFPLPGERGGQDVLPVESPFPPRLLFLLEAIKPAMSTDYLNGLFSTLLSSGDISGAAACAGAGVASIWDQGYEFQAFDIWHQRIKDLLNEPEDRLDHLARASILGFKGQVEMMGWGDLATAEETFKVQRHWADRARSASLLAYHAFLQGHCYMWGGKFCEMEILISDIAPLVDQPETSCIARVFFGYISGLFQTLMWDVTGGKDLLGRIVADPAFGNLPPSVQLLGQGILMIPIVLEGNMGEIEALSERIKRQAIPEQNSFHQSLLSISLGIAALNTGRPYRALLHARDAIQRSRLSGSPVLERIASLLLGEALIDLNEVEEARAHLLQWIITWEETGFNIFAIGGALEMANLSLKEGKMDEARGYYEMVQQWIPEREKLPSLFRSREFMERLAHSLSPERVGKIQSWTEEGKVVLIRTFGELLLDIGGRILYDRKWRSGRTKMLLKYLIAHGGTKVSAFKMAMLLWPDAEGDRAMGNLKVALSRLLQLGVTGKVCIPAWVHTRFRQISLVQGLCSVDSLAFAQGLPVAIREGDIEGLLRLLELYVDDFLVNDMIEAWIINRRQELQEMFFRGVERLVHLCLQNRREDVALPYTEKAIHKDPLRESLYEHRMRLFLSMGYHAEVLRTYKMACRNLKQGLGITPGPALVALARKAGGSH